MTVSVVEKLTTGVVGRLDKADDFGSLSALFASCQMIQSSGRNTFHGQRQAISKHDKTYEHIRNGGR
jgi:hypothetical protein